MMFFTVGRGVLPCSGLVTAAHAGQRGHGGLGFLAQTLAQRMGRGGQFEREGHAAVGHRHLLRHAERHEILPELGIDHTLQGLEHRGRLQSV
jgi:hypothetical protein